MCISDFNVGLRLGIRLAVCRIGFKSEDRSSQQMVVMIFNYSHIILSCKDLTVTINISFSYLFGHIHMSK